MPDQNLTPPSLGRSLSPEEITSHVFPTSRKGLSPDAVKQFLGEVAVAVRELRNELRTASLQRPTPQVVPPVLDEEALTKALGEETTRVLKTARESAQSIVTSAENQAAELIGGAETLSQNRRNEADALARSTQDRAEEDAAQLVEKTKSECRSMIEEAREARRRILADLAERRRILLVQLEQVRVGRESMASAIDTVAAGVMKSIEEVRLQLGGAEESARIAAEQAASELDEKLLEGSEVVDALVEEALAKLPQAGDSAVFTSFAGTTPVVNAERVFDIEREQQPQPVAPATPTAVSSGSKGAGPGSDEPQVPAASPALGRADTEETGTSRRPDATPTVGQVPVSAPVVKDLAAPPAAQPVPETNPVDQLFAKIRASRESEVADAQRVLGADDEAMGATLEDGIIDVTPFATERSDHHEQAAPTDPEEELPPPLAFRSRRDSLLEVVQVDLARSLKRVLREEQNLLLDALRNLKKGDKLDSLLLASAAKKRLIAEVSPAIENAHVAAAEFLELTPRRGRKRTSTVEETTPTIERLADEILDALNAKLTPVFRSDAAGTDDAIEAVSSAFRVWKALRVESLAADYVTAAFGEGAIASASAKKLSLTWNLDDAGSNCPDCDDNSVAGPVLAGEAFPTGHVHPPVHPGCRCFLSIP